MRFSRSARVLVAVAAALWAGGAGAFLETGTLLTNSASATYRAGTEGTSLSYSATAKILIANPSMFVWKTVSPTSVSMAGGFVTFSISFSNGGANTAFNVTIFDKIPPSPLRLPICSSTSYNAWVVGGAITKFEYSVDNAIYTEACPVTAPPIGAEYFRWSISQVGIGSSGLITMVMQIVP